MIQKHSQLHSMSLKRVQGSLKGLKLKIESDYQALKSNWLFPHQFSSLQFCQPSIYNRPQNYMSSSCLPQKHLTNGCKLQNVISCGYRPLNFASITCHPLKYLSYDRQPLGYESSSFRPLDFVSNSVQPVPYIHSSFQPAFPSFGTWQSPFIR
ncbi:LOW QUALITY PROTEIN: keratin-associated protein 25-1 [Balaenoptera acutorostrata]|uniref:Keratin-associated protein n=1 Tax=Balaenoptera acutorostrata TaxID=9767 RepID=A0A452C701_BALAC|nr:LOW QUALITY PROTEIN: keratin-associated protein 25-1 [Balaenoptera acutorostrata]